jgi:hypothetical protein
MIPDDWMILRNTIFIQRKTGKHKTTIERKGDAKDDFFMPSFF